MSNPFGGLLAQNYSGLRPFKSGEFIKNKDGTVSTELSVTVPIGDAWVNVPSLWMGPNGHVRLTEDQAREEAMRHEQQTGTPFPRFKSIDEAVKAAKSRSNSGGASRGLFDHLVK